MPHHFALPLILAVASLSLAAPANPPLVVVIEGNLLGQGAEHMRHQAHQRAASVQAALRAARVPFMVTRDTDVAKYGLPSAPVVILPYNRAISPPELQKLLHFLQRGGHLIACFTGHADLLAAIGVQADHTIRAPQPGSFAAMVCQTSSLPGLPPEVALPSSQVRACAPRRNARTIAYWRASDGTRSSRPAVILSDRGAFVNAVFEGQGDLPAQAALLRALCAHFAPEIWQQSIPTQPSHIAPLGNYASLEHMKQALLERQRAGEDTRRALGAVAQVTAALAAVRQALSANDINAALRAALEAERLAHRAYWMSYPSKSGELRAVWASSSVSPDWDTALRTIRDHNLNAVFPYFCSAGAAWFRTDLLPCASTTDYLQRATDAARKYGVPVHARMLNLYAMEAPAKFKTQLADEGRLMVSSTGKPTNWLCPAHPKNRALQVRLAVELVSRYPIAGLQLDYMRFPGESYCFCKTCRLAFQQYAGCKPADMPAAVKTGPLREKFLQFRRDLITSLARDLCFAARQAQPHAAISAAVFLNWQDHRDAFAQDWKAWVEEGLVDFVCPMNYTASNDRFAQWTQRQIHWVGSKTLLCPGIGVNADGVNFPGPQGLLDQITIARNLNTDGWAIFNYAPNLVRDYLPYLKLGATSTPTGFNPFRHVLMPPPGG